MKAIDRFCFVAIVVVAGFPRGSPPLVGKHENNIIKLYELPQVYSSTIALMELVGDALVEVT